MESVPLAAGQHPGRPLGEIVRRFMKWSNNHIGESLVKGLGAHRGSAPAGWNDGVAALRAELARNGIAVDERGLTIPHPGIASRNFVLLPLRDIAPDFEIPGLGRVRDLPVSDSEPRISKIA